MDAMKLQYNIHHIKESFHPCFNQGLQKLLVQKGGVAHALGGGGLGGGREAFLLATLLITGFHHLQFLSPDPI